MLPIVMRKLSVVISISIIVIFGYTRSYCQVIEGVTFTQGEHRYCYKDTIISPLHSSNAVLFKETAKVSYKTPEPIYLRSGFSAYGFSQGGYFLASFPFDVDLLVTKDCNSSEGTIGTVIYGGVPTFTYLWSTSETSSSITYTNSGIYSVTVTDDRGLTSTASVTINTPFYSSIYWTDNTGVEVSNDTIKKIFDTGWGNSGAVSRNRIDPGVNGFAEYKVTIDEYYDNLTFRRFWGLSDSNPNANYNTIDFAFYFEEDSVEIRENGTSKCAQFKYFQTDIFRIERSGDTIKYVVNGEVLQTSLDTTNSEKELMVDISLFNENAYFSGIRTSGCPTGLHIDFAISPYTKDSLRTLTAIVSNGMPPYTYSWNTSDTSQIINAYTTQYTVSVSDNWGGSATAGYVVTEPVLWTVLDSTVLINDTLLSISADTNWVSGALSRNILQPDESGVIKYIVTDSSFTDNSSKQRVFGFSSMDYNEPGKDNIDVAFYLDRDSLRVVKSGVVQESFGTYSSGDTLIISLIQNPDYWIDCIRNSDTLWGDNIVSSTYFVDASLAGDSSYFDNLEVSFSAPVSVLVVKEQDNEDSLIVSFESMGGVPPYTNYWDNNQVEITQFQTQKGYYPLGVSDALSSYSNFLVPIDSKKDKYWLVNNDLVVSNDTISKSSAYGGYNCILSDNVMKSYEDGFVEYNVSYEEYKTNTGKRIFGLSERNTSGCDSSEISYGFYFDGDSISRYEKSGGSAIPVGGFFKFKPGDVYQIIRQGDSIFYVRNYEVINQQFTDNSSELRLDVNILTSGSWFAPFMTSFRAPLKVNYDIVKECDSGTGTISLNIERGSPPYTYAWSTSDTTQNINFTQPGTYTVTVTDSIGVVKIKSIDVLFNDMANIEWIDQDSVIVSTDTIQSMALASGNSGAASKNILSSNSNGLIDYRIIESDYNDNLNLNRYLGFSDRNINNQITSIDYGYWFNQDTLRVVENDSVFDISVAYNIEDHCQILRSNDSIIYKVNSDTLRITTTDPAKELMVDVAFDDSSAYFKGVKASFCPLQLQVFNFDVTKECSVGTGTIKANPVGGTPPYSYLWSTSATTQSITFSSTGDYIVTVTDNVAATVVDTIRAYSTQTLANVTWTDLYNTEIVSDTLRKLVSATDTLWNADAISENILQAGEDGFVEITITKESYYDNSEKQIYIGLNDRNTDSSYVGMDYAWYFNKSEVRIYEEGIFRIYDIHYKPGDKFLIERSEDNIYFRQNGNVLLTTTTDPSRELFVDASFYNREAYLAGVKSSFCKPSLEIFMTDFVKDCDSSTAIVTVTPQGGQAPYSYAWSTSDTIPSITVSSTGNYYVTVTDDSSNSVIDTIYVDLNNTRSLVEWNSIDSVSINNDTVACIASLPYNSGMAYSSNKLEAAQNGYVEWYETKNSYIDNQNKYRSIGFSDFNDDANKYSVLYGAYFNRYELGAIANSEVVIDSGSYKPGDILRIERYGDSIFYKVNSETIWTVKTDPSRELTLFTSLTDSAAYFHNIKTDFCPVPLQDVVFEKSKACNSSTGYLQVLVSGGKEPYDYSWSTSDTTDITNFTSNGTYYVTVTDAESNTVVGSKSVNTDILAHINWIVIDSCEVDSAALRSTQYAQGWTASAYSLNTLTAGNDGEMQYYISKDKYSENCTKQLQFGLIDSDPASSSVLDYAWYFSSDTLRIYENDSLLIDSIDYQAGDLLTIKRAGDTIKYYINDSLYRSKYETTISDQKLKVFAKLYDPGTNVTGVKTTFCPEDLRVAWYEATRSCEDDSGRIDINIVGGVPPYEYAWSNNDSTSTTYYSTTGNYTVTVTDSWGDTSTLTANISTTNNAVPQWYSYNGYSISTDSIIKTIEGSNWNYAAITRNRFNKGDDGNVSYLVTKGDFSDNKTYFRRIGLADIVDDSTNFRYGWLLDEDSLKIVENTTIFTIGLYADEDRLTVKRDGDTIRYIKNTTTIRSVFTDTNRILIGKISSYNPGGYFSHVRISVCPAPEILVNHTLTKASPDSLGDITTQVSQGVLPYTYYWSTGDTTSGVDDLACGIYKITVTDSVGYVAVSNIYVSDPVSWTNLVGTEASQDTLERTDTINGWHCGAATANTLRNGLDGAIIYNISDTLDYDKIKVLGLADASPNTAYDLVDYAFYFREDSVEIYESGEMITEIGGYAIDDEFVIARQGDSIRYFKNNVLLREISTNSDAELHGYASLYSSGSGFKDIRTTFLPESSMLVSYYIDSVLTDNNYLLKLNVSGGATPYSYNWSNGHTSDTLTTVPTGYRVSVTDKLGFLTDQPVMLTPVSWINTDSTSVSDDRLYADHSQTEWNAGAFSGNILEVGSNGFVFYQSTDTTNKNMIRILGFSDIEENVADTTVDYGFLFDEDTLKIVESGTIIDTIGKYTTGDRFHIFRSGIDIRYMFNDTIVREMTDSTLSEKSLIVDVSFKSPDASFESVMTSFSYPASLHIAHTITPNSDRNDIRLTVTGGLSPYTYEWNNGQDSSEITYVATGEYIVTVTDFVGTSQTGTFYLFEDVSWNNLDSAAVFGDTLLKSQQYGTEMNSWGTAVNILNAYRNGAVGYTVSTAGYSDNDDKVRSFGLSNSTDDIRSDIDYAFVLDNEVLRISENGTVKYDNLEYSTGDNLQIVRTGNNIEYYKNDTLLREISVSNTSTLVAKAGFGNRDAYFDHLEVSFVAPMQVAYRVTGFRNDSLFNTKITASEGYSPYVYSWDNGSITDTSNVLPGRYEVSVTDSLNNYFSFNVNLPNVTWGSLDTAVINGDTLFHDSPKGTGIGGAFSTNIIRANTDGFLSYGESDSSYTQNKDIRRAIGLSETNGTNEFTSIKYGFNFYKDSVYVIESGISKTTNVKYQAGDAFSIDRSDTLLTYYINDTYVRQITVDKSKVLYAEAAISSGGYFESVVISQYSDMVFTASIIHRYNETMGTVNLAVSGGLPPYTYLWNNGSVQDTITNLIAGAYIVTVTDAAENKKAYTYPVLRNTVWKNIVDLSFNSDTLRKTSGTSGWTAGALARNFLPAYTRGMILNKDNSTTYSANSSKRRMFGLSTENSGPDSSTIKYAFMLDGTALKVYEDGVFKKSCGTYAANKSMYILRSNDTIYYYYNGTAQKATIVDPSEVLYPDVSMYTPQSYFYKLAASFELPEITINYTVQNKTTGTLGEITVTPSEGTPPYTYDWSTSETTASIDSLYPGGYNVTVTDSTGLTNSATIFVMGDMIWNNHNHTVLSNDTLYKINDTYIWDADAVSANILHENTDGAVEFAVTGTTDTLKRRCIGLTTGNINSNPYTIDYRFFVDGKQVSAFNKGENLGSFGNFAAGDTFRIARAGSNIKYYRDKTVLATISVDPAEELMTDVAFYEDSAYFDNVLASFSDSTYDVVPYKPVYAGTTVNIYPDKDAVIYEAYPSTNFGTDTSFIASKNGATNYKIRSLMEYDVSWIPENAIITNATLYLKTYDSKGHSAVNNHSVLVMNDTIWFEDSVTWNNKPSADTAGVGYIDIPASDSTLQDYSIDMKDFVDAWYSSEKDNYGITFRLYSESTAAEMFFESSDGPDSLKHPRLEISYYVPVKLVATMYPDIDAVIYNIDSTTTGATNTAFMASADTTGSDAIRRSLMKFDLSVIPPNAIIDSARLYVFGTDHSGSNAAYLRRVTANWYEDSVTWKTQPATDIRQQISISQTGSATEDDTLDVKELVQNWVDGTYANYGMLLKLQNENIIARLKYASSDNTDTTIVPKLEVFYSIQPLEVPYTIETDTVDSTNTLRLAAYGGTPPYTYTWADGSTSKTIDDLDYGSYKVTVTDAWGSWAVRDVSVEKVVNSSGSSELTDAKNWRQVKVYTYENASSGGTVISENRNYYDLLGKGVQFQAKSKSTDKVIVSQMVYDAKGRAVLQTLPTVVSQNSLNYIDKLIANPQGDNYSYSDFDLKNTNLHEAGEANNPVKVSTSCAVGNYYSNNNTDEPFVAQSSYPYSRIEYSETVPGMVKTTTLAGDDHKMGSGHEAREFSINATSTELYDVYGVFGWIINSVGDPFEEGIDPVDTLSFLKYENIVKNISVDNNGEEFVSYYRPDGNLLASCKSGQKDGSNVREYYVSSEIGENKDYVDIHLPEGTNQSLILDYALGGTYDIIDLKTDKIIKSDIELYTDYNGTYNNEPTDDWYLGVNNNWEYGGCDPVTWDSPYYWQDESFTYFLCSNMGNHIIGDDNYLTELVYRVDNTFNYGTTGTEYTLSHAFLHVNNLPAGFYRIVYHRREELSGSVEITYKLNYYNFALNYFNQAGDLVKTVPPSGVDYDYNRTIATESNIDMYNNLTCSVNTECMTIPTTATEVPEGKLRYFDVSLKLVPSANTIVEKCGIVTPIGIAQDGSPVYKEVLNISNLDQNGMVTGKQQVFGLKTFHNVDDSLVNVYLSDNYVYQLSGDSVSLFMPTISDYKYKTLISSAQALYNVNSNNYIENNSNLRMAASNNLNQQYQNNGGYFPYHNEKINHYTVIIDKNDPGSLMYGIPDEEDDDPDDPPDDPIDPVIPPVNCEIAGRLTVTCDIKGKYSDGSEKIIFSNIKFGSLFYSDAYYDEETEIVEEGDIHVINYFGIRTRVIVPPQYAEGLNALVYIVKNTEGAGSLENIPAAGVRFSVIQKIVDDTPTHTMASTCTINSLSEVEKTYSPDKGTTEYIYRKDGSLRFSQNQKQLAANKFSYVNYDKSGRIIETGESTGTFSSLDGDITTVPGTHSEQRYISYDKPDVAGIEALDPVSHTYSDNFYQRFTLGQVTKTWNANSTTWFSYNDMGRLEWLIRNIDGLGVKTTRYTYNFVGQITEVKCQELDNDEKFIYRYYYDNDGRPNRVTTEEFVDGTSQGVIEQGEYSYYQHGPLKRVELADNLQGIDYIYTINGWLKSINSPDLGKTVNGAPADPGQDGFGASGFSQDVFGMAIDYFNGDYRRKGGFSNPFFGTNINTADPTTPGLDNYNGVIKSVRWRIKDQVPEGNQLPSGSQWAFTYQYDEFYRLTDAVFGTFIPDENENSGTGMVPNTGDIALRSVSPGGTSISDVTNELQQSALSQLTQTRADANYYNLWGESDSDNKTDVGFTESQNVGYFNINNIVSKALTETFADHSLFKTTNSQQWFVASSNEEYKVWNIRYHENGNNNGSIKGDNGNIAYMNRNGYGANIHMDELTYHYQAGTNKLLRVYDQISSGNYTNDIDNQTETENYVYSDIGELTRNEQEGINYEYNAYHQISKIYKDDGPFSILALEYFYDDMGQLYKTKDYINDRETYYNKDAFGKIQAIYVKPDGGSLTLTEIPIYGTTRLGTYYKGGDYVYEITDHLGNMRALIKKDIYEQAEMLAYADYDPWGMELDGRCSWPSGDYRYTYQGQYAEKNPVLSGTNDFMLRQYDARIGRWTTTDPAGVGFSPYEGMANNPVMCVDPLGAWPRWKHWWKTLTFQKNRKHCGGGGADNSLYEDFNQALSEISDELNIASSDDGGTGTPDFSDVPGFSDNGSPSDFNGPGNNSSSAHGGPNSMNNNDNRPTGHIASEKEQKAWKEFWAKHPRDNSNKKRENIYAFGPSIDTEGQPIVARPKRKIFKVTVQKNPFPFNSAFFNPYDLSINIPASYNDDQIHDAIMHEFGHYIQLRALQYKLGNQRGLEMFISAIAIPSMMSSKSKDHMKKGYEKSASDLGRDFFKQDYKHGEAYPTNNDLEERIKKAFPFKDEYENFLNQYCR